MKKIDLVCG